MKVAVVCAIIGGIDEPKGIPRQNTPYTYHYYTENNLPFPLPNLNARMRSKYVKIMMHRFLPDYDAYIWVDGKVQVLENNFVELMIKNLPGNDVCIFRHQERNNPIEEIEFIEKHMSQGSKYVLSRYGNQMIEREKELFSDRMALYETTLFCRLNTADTSSMFEEWWMKLTEYSCFDQALFSSIATELSIHELSREDFKDIFKINKHLCSTKVTY